MTTPNELCAKPGCGRPESDLVHWILAELETYHAFLPSPAVQPSEPGQKSEAQRDASLRKAVRKYSRHAQMSDEPADSRATGPFDCESALRHEWWMNHGCDIAAAYGDDGEMQCHLRDFKREPITELAAHVREMRMRRMYSAPTDPQLDDAMTERIARDICLLVDASECAALDSEQEIIQIIRTAMETK